MPKRGLSALSTIAEATYLEIIAMGVALREEDDFCRVAVEICYPACAIG